ncbi:MAG: hypothetical protein KF774_11175 [Planctomyces sp.]|nr:hypothetical protein [Planctomyces sp.]
MTRAFFLGTGVYVALAGATFFLVESVTLAAQTSADTTSWIRWMTTDALGQGRRIHPPEWLPYTLVAVGGVTVLYAIALPKAAWKKD